MNKDLENACIALEALGNAVINSWPADVTMTEALGWFAPSITRHELGSLALTLASDIRSTEANVVSPSVLPLVVDLPRRLSILQANTIPQMYSSNGGQAAPAYIATMNFLRSMLLPSIGWQTVLDKKSLPSELLRRAKAAETQLKQLAPKLEKLQSQISDIQNAHAISDSLPIVLQDLDDAKEKINETAGESAGMFLKIKEANDLFYEKLKEIEQVSVEAQQLVKQCESAYHITTTKGLAGAFDQRAKNLSISTWAWVAGLAIALSIGSYIGTERIQALSATLNSATTPASNIGFQLLLSVLSIGAPLWFSWLATKQIGQRFKLAEDYAFKASVAKAYEGYRKEAARIDPKFEARLFGSALTRLDEAPLRLVESTNHGSPWHELINSDAAQQALQTIPGLRDKVTSLLRDGIDQAAKLANKNEPKETTETPS